MPHGQALEAPKVLGDSPRMACRLPITPLAATAAMMMISSWRSDGDLEGNLGVMP